MQIYGSCNSINSQVYEMVNILQKNINNLKNAKTPNKIFEDQVYNNEKIYN